MNTTGETVVSLSEFLLARFAEDEEGAKMRPREWWSDRLEAECGAKRRIVESEDAPYPTGHAPNTRTKRLLALPYADHPDYNPEWRP